MNINAITGYKHQVSILKQTKQPKNISFTNAQTTPLTEDDFKRANEYCKNRCYELGKRGNSIPYPTFSLLYNFNLDELNGIQYGIDLFDGMTMKEVAFTLNSPTILLNRGCNNLCSHCFINALPPQRLNGVKSFTYEDFEKLIKGISELKSRIEKYNVKLSMPDFSYLFCDSDCINVEIEDKNGKKYDIIDCFELLRKNGFITYGQYDTSGWTPTLLKHQKRAEKLVKYIQDIYNDDSIKNKPISNVMVSINPFHSIYQKYLDLKDSSPEKAKKYKDLYVNRMANVLYTFSPLTDIKWLSYSINFTALNSNPNYDYKVIDGLIKDILTRLEEMYDEKGVSSELKNHYLDMYRKIIDKFIEITMHRYREIGRAGRGIDIIPGLKTRQDRTQFQEEYKSLKLRQWHIDRSDVIIEPNGQIKMQTNTDIVIPTDIQLNLDQKDKNCSPLGDEVLGVRIKPNDADIHIDNNIRLSRFVF